MKGNKHGFRRILAILLCVMLFVSNLVLTAFADEGTTTLTDREENAGEIINDSKPKYVLSGSTPVPMSEILTALGLTGEVTAVEISDESLFSASNESGVWIVTAHQEFSSTEWMKVTVSDAVYEITVTESGAISSGLNGTDSSGYTGDREEAVERIRDGALAALKPYSVIVEDGITGGTVTTDKSQAVANEIITVTVTPETEYELQTLTYTPADTGEPVTVSLPPEPDAGTGSYTATFDMPAANVTVNAAFRSTAPSEWSQLVAAFSEGGVVTLTQDVAAQEGDGRLVVPSGKTVTLDLNGHTLGPSNNNEVIYIGGGTLILTGDGTITGGNKNLYGIYAESSGTVTMNDGTITGVNQDGISLNSSSSCTMNGGAIRNCPQFGVDILNSSFTLNGGEITGSGFIGVDVDSNNCSFTLNGGKISGSGRYDVYVDSNNFHLSGGTVSGMILLRQDSRIVIDSRLDPDACYSLDMETVDRFTYGLNGKGDLSNFKSVDSRFTIALDEQGEAMMVRSGTVAPYVECSWNGEKVVSKLTSRNNGQWQGFPDDANITSGWYYLDHNVTKNNRIVSITGDVNLILGDGCKLDVKGLYVPEGCTLTIYGQSAGTGKIYSHPSGGAAIGGYSEHNNGNIVIHSGTVEANGYDHCAGIGSNDGYTGGFITIYGGTVTAKGGSDGAGIGGGRSRTGGDITIYGGDITAKGGGSNGAGIGGGQHGDGGTINIYGGTVTTSDSPNENGAGIGGGDSAAGGNITIYGGTITTYSRDGAGIGGGDDGDGGDITINGGTIHSYKENQGQGARIGGGCNAAPGSIIINDGTITTASGSGAGIGGGKGNKSGGSVTINGGVIKADGDYGIGSGEGGANVPITMGYTDATKNTISVTSINYGGTVTLNDDFVRKNTDIVIRKGTYTDTSQMAGVTLKAYVLPEIPYVDLAGEPQSEVCIPVSSNTTAWDNNWYAVTENVDITGEITVTGDVNLILADGFKLTSKNIKVSAGNSLTVWGQSGGSGEIVASAGHDTKAGIGGAGSDCGTITVNGGTVTATGGQASNEYGYGSAGIGGCLNGKTGTVIINGGTVTATGGKRAAGIGGGGIMPAYPGQISSDGRVEINGGTVTATGKAGGAGIGSGFLCPSDGRSDGVGEIVINGGTVNAYGSDADNGGGAGIGGGMKSQAGTITITGGTINAEGTEWAPAIGTGGMDPEDLSDEACVGGAINISGGTVTATVPDYSDPDDFNEDAANAAAAIGGGCNGGGVTIDISGGVVTATSGRIGMGYGYGRSDLPCTINLSWTEESKETMSVTSTSYYSPVNLKNAFRDKNDGTIFPAQDSVRNRLNGRTLIPYEIEDPSPVVAIKGVTGSFNDKIKLNYYFDFPDTVLADDAAYVTLSNADTETTLTLPIKEASFTAGKGYKFSISLAAKEAGDTITARVYDGNDRALEIRGSSTGSDYTGSGVQYTLMQYFDWLSKESEDDNEKAVGAAARDYCAAAQIYFGYHASGLSVSDDVTDLDAAALSAFVSEKSGTIPTGVSIKGISAMLESDNTLRLYFSFEDIDPAGFTYTIDGKPVSLSQRPDGEYYLALKEGVYSNHLQDTHTYSVSDGTDTYMITASVLTYARSCVIKKKGTEEEKNLGKALYLYNAAAVAAFGQ